MERCDYLIFSNFFSIKLQYDRTSTSLKEYLKSFAEDCNEDMHVEFDFEFLTNELKNIANPVFENSQIECLNYVAGSAIFSSLKDVYSKRTKVFASPNIFHHNSFKIDIDRSKYGLTPKKLQQIVLLF